MRSVILLSGGLDSMISYRLWYPRSLPVFVNTGAVYTGWDYQCAMEIAGRQLELLHAPILQEQPSGAVPHRNALLLALVAAKYDATEIVVSAPRGELIWDQQPAFHRGMEKVLRGVKIRNPLQDLTKTQAVGEYRAWHKKHRIPYEIPLTRSCYSNRQEQCGNCAACFKRWVSLTNNGLSEAYDVDPRRYAERVMRGATLRDAFRYGLRPLWEAHKALRRA